MRSGDNADLLAGIAIMHCPVPPPSVLSTDAESSAGLRPVLAFSLGCRFLTSLLLAATAFLAGAFSALLSLSVMPLPGVASFYVGFRFCFYL